MKLIHLIEARRNPELNVKAGALHDLLKYQGKDDVYVSFGSINKIGVNPRSHFDTPLGVYAYPIDYVLRGALRDGKVNGSMPYASDRKFIHVIRARGRGLNLQAFPGTTIMTSMDILTDRLGVSDDVIRDAMETAHETTRDPATIWWYFTHNIAKHTGVTRSMVPMVAWNRILRELGYDYIVDHGGGIIHSNEATQAVFLSKEAFTQIEMIPNVTLNEPLDIDEYKANTFHGRGAERAVRELLEPHLKMFGAGIIYNGSIGDVFTIWNGSVTNRHAGEAIRGVVVNFKKCKLIECNLMGEGTKYEPKPRIMDCTVRGGVFENYRFLDSNTRRSTLIDCDISGGTHQNLSGHGNDKNRADITAAPGQSPIKDSPTD